MVSAFKIFYLVFDCYKVEINNWGELSRQIVQLREENSHQKKALSIS